MSEKATCPGCDSHTSAIYAVLHGTDPWGKQECPYCGLPRESMVAVIEARRRKADADLTERFAAAEIRAGRAEAELVKLRHRLDRIRQAVEDDEDGDVG